MRRLVQALILVTCLGATRALAHAQAAPTGPAGDRVAAWVAQLAAPSRGQRLEAQELLLALSDDDARALETAVAPDGFEARAALDYARTHRPAPVLQSVVPAGRYHVGSSLASDRNPKRDVTLDAFSIDDCEVTCFEYWRFVRATGTPPPSGWVDGRYAYGGERLPLGNVSPDEAQRFAAWVGGRLPTSDEWEVAATGGTGRPFPWDEAAIPRLANSVGVLVDVRSEPQDHSPFGGFDFCGSLREWVVAMDGSVAPRGGWLNSGQFVYLRLTRAADGGLTERRPFIGLRVCNRRR